MSGGAFLTLGSIEAARPVFMIVMGVFMLMFAWRLAKVSDAWTARLLMAGALMLAFGYTLLLPLYDAGVLERYSPARQRYHGSAATALVGAQGHAQKSLTQMPHAKNDCHERV